MKLRIVVVDDENPIREWLLYCIRQASPDYETVAAANGAEAYQQILDIHPDLVFTDICMPVMDGLELMRRVGQVLPIVKFIILTNYAEFSYAKQALSLGASEYLLKSEMRAADVTALLAQTVRAKEKIQRAERNQLSLRRYIDLSEYYRLRTDSRQALAYLHDSGLAENHPYQVYCLQDAANPMSWTAMSELADELKRQTDGTVLTAIEKQRQYVILQSDRLFSSGYSPDLPESYALGISSSAQTAAAFENLLHEAATALDYRFFTPQKRRIFFTDLPAGQGQEQMLVQEQMMVCMRLLSEYRMQEANTALTQLFSMLQHPPAQDTAWAAERCRRVVLSVEEYYTRETELAVQRSELPATAAQCFSYCQELLDALQRNHLERRSPSIDNALQFIHRHYNEDISLATVARQVYHSPEYFSRRFKAETGENFSSYLTLYRLKRAQELLHRTTLSIGEIAERVGYTSAGYFSKLYRKYNGISPEQDRKSKYSQKTAK